MGLNFFKAAQNLGDFAGGYAAGDLQRDKELAQERLGLLQLGMSAGAHGIDASGMVTPDMVSRGNRDYVAQTYPTMTGKFTQGFRDKLNQETALTNAKLDREEKIWDKRMVKENEVWDKRLAVQQQMNKDDLDNKLVYYDVLRDNARESAAARVDAARARAEMGNNLSYNAALEDRKNADQTLETLALNKLRSQYGDQIFTPDGKNYARPEFARMVDEYKLNGMRYLESNGAFSTTKSQYQPGQFRPHAVAFDKAVGYAAPEDHWFSPNKAAGFSFPTINDQPGTRTASGADGSPAFSTGGGDVFTQLSPLRDRFARLPESERGPAVQAAYSDIVKANPGLANNPMESQRILGILSGKITR